MTDQQDAAQAIVRWLNSPEFRRVASSIQDAQRRGDLAKLRARAQAMRSTEIARTEAAARTAQHLANSQSALIHSQLLANLVTSFLTRYSDDVRLVSDSLNRIVMNPEIQSTSDRWARLAAVGPAGQFGHRHNDHEVARLALSDLERVADELDGDADWLTNLDPADPQYATLEELLTSGTEALQQLDPRIQQAQARRLLRVVVYLMTLVILLGVYFEAPAFGAVSGGLAALLSTLGWDAKSITTWILGGVGDARDSDDEPDDL